MVAERFLGIPRSPWWVLVGSLGPPYAEMLNKLRAWGSLEPPWGILGEPWGAIGGPWRVPGEDLGGPMECSGCLLRFLGVPGWPFWSHWGLMKTLKTIEFVLF